MLEEIKTIQTKYRIIGRQEELGSALAAAHVQKHVLLEGAVGVGKTVIAMALASHLNRHFHRVDGDERYTEHKLTGWFDPSSVMSKGYSWETFIPGSLTQAMVDGAFLFINELNRMPEGTQNVLLPAMDEGQIHVPRIGEVKAKSGFLIIATQNPEEFVGTSRLGEALKDRFVWIRLDYQPEDEEQKVVQKETGCEDWALISTATKIARRTREEPEIRRGASIRGAIDIVDLIRRMSGSFTQDQNVWIKASMIALPTKIELQEQTPQKMESIIKKIVAAVLSEIPEDIHLSNGGVKHDSKSREETTPSNSPGSRQISRAGFEVKDVKQIADLLIQDPKAVSDLLLQPDLFENVLRLAERTETRWSGISLLSMLHPSLDPAHKRVAKRVLVRMITRLAAQIAWRGISATGCKYVPFNPELEEFDIEQTCENSLNKGYVDYRDIVSIERFRKKSAVSLLFDTSNSMQQQKIVIAAIAVGVLAHKLREDYHSVIMFKDQPEVIKHMTDRLDVEGLVDRVLDLKPGGLTDIEKALKRGLEELNTLEVQDRAGILITDGWVTKGGNPVRVAEKYPRLHVIQVPLGIGGGDPRMCADLAKAGRGKHSYTRSFYQLPHAILSVLR